MTDIRLYSGKTVNIFGMTIEDIDIEDIARSLSRQCRYNGHSKGHISVAEHSVWVSCAVPEKFALEGLLHDAAEAYVGDVTVPIKEMLPQFKDLEMRIWRVIAHKFDLPVILSTVVDVMDKKDALTEIESGLMGGWEANVAYREFMKRYRELVG